MIERLSVAAGAERLRAGGVVAYPTEAVYGLGCDPFDEAAVERLLALKGRSHGQGLILIAQSLRQLDTLIEPAEPAHLARAQATWPGPVTWLFPASQRVPVWITGGHDRVAVRVTAHPIAAALARRFEAPLVSTSANRSGEPPAREPAELERQFGDRLDGLVEGELGELPRPTEIRDAATGASIRGG